MIDAPVPATADALSRVLSAFRLTGSLVARMSLRAPWGYAVPEHPELGLVVVTRGRLHFEKQGAEPVALELVAGDVVAIPQGDAFTLRDAPGTPLVPIEQSGACSETGELSMPGAQTELLVLRCGLDGGCSNPVRQALPRLIHCPGSDGRVARWLEPGVRMLAHEGTGLSPGRTTVINRLAEVVFIQLLRAWLDQQPADSGGWLRATADPPLAAALDAIHSEPGHAWTVETLATRAGLSRSAFAARFRAMTGRTPLDYLTRWRMHRARALIERGDQPLKQIVASLGYASEAAFRIAFRRHVGATPGEYRAQRRAEAGVALG